MKKQLFPLLAIMLSTACTKDIAKESLTIADDVVGCAVKNEPIKFVKIGSAKWTTRNLDVARYKNGDLIPQVQDPAKWACLKTGAWCYYNNDPKNGKLYGKLYNWYAVNDPRGLAPKGFHIPSRDELFALIDHLGGAYDGPADGWIIAAGKMKATGTIEAGTGLWYAPNTGATNSSGFTAIPAGLVSNGFVGIGAAGYWWTKGDYAEFGDYFSLFYFEDRIYFNYFEKYVGCSVRLIKDH
jgi:uncharacterized protein (TIGR02145 family)